LSNLLFFGNLVGRGPQGSRKRNPLNL
jgi:hypothetical protein